MHENASPLSGQLEAAGYSTVLQAWDIRPGDGFVREMNRALVAAKRTLSVLSHAYLRSPYAAMEWQEALRADKLGTRRALVPVRIDDVEPSGLLGQMVYIDMFGVGELEARERLVAGVRSERAKPSREPAFPGDPEPAFPTTAAGPDATPTPRLASAAPRQRTPTPPTARHVRKIVTALGALDVTASPASLAAVVRQLPAEISSRLAAQPGRLDVYLTELVRACFEYPAGLGELLEILDYYERGTLSMGNLLDAVEGVTAELGHLSGGSSHPPGSVPSETSPENQG